MAYRSKTPERVAAELKELRATYKRNMFVMSDNILDMQYINNLFPVLKEDKEGFKLWYEAKSNLKKENIQKITEGGVFYIQAGIESLSTRVLRLMAKGITLLQNLQTLKWCKEANLGVGWNILYGFPGEEENDYLELINLIPSLVHLPYPHGSGQIRVDRFSPYWRSPEQYGLINVTHARGYDFVYSGIPAAQRARLAYFFDFDYSDGKKTRDYFKTVQQALFQWWNAARRGATLQFEKRDDRTVIRDTRFSDAPALFDISDAELALLRAFDTKMRVEKACETVSAQSPDLSGDMLMAAFENLRLRKWIIDEDGVFISLVLDFPVANIAT
jgi:ribosomal peptide maturation radical SAM protein 1